MRKKQQNMDTFLMIYPWRGHILDRFSRPNDRLHADSGDRPTYLSHFSIPSKEAKKLLSVTHRAAHSVSHFNPGFGWVGTFFDSAESTFHYWCGFRDSRSPDFAESRRYTNCDEIVAIIKSMRYSWRYILPNNAAKKQGRLRRRVLPPRARRA